MHPSHLQIRVIQKVHQSVRLRVLDRRSKPVGELRDGKHCIRRSPGDEREGDDLEGAADEDHLGRRRRRYRVFGVSDEDGVERDREGGSRLTQPRPKRCVSQTLAMAPRKKPILAMTKTMDMMM